MLKVLYITGTGPFGGSSRSLYEAVRAMPEGTVEPYFVASSGTALEYYRRVAKDAVIVRGISRFDHSWVGYYKGARWLVLLREIARLPQTLAAIWRARRRWPDIDLIHVNEFLELIPALVAKRMFKVPLVVHVRALMMADRRLWRTRWIVRMLRKADAVVAIDGNVRATLPDDLDVDVIHNGFDPRTAAEAGPAFLARLDDLRPTSLKVGYIGNLWAFKGPGDLFEAARLVKASGDDVQYLIVGGSAFGRSGLLGFLAGLTGLARDMRAELEEAIPREGLERDFLLLGATGDIQQIIPKMDVLAFASRLNAPGRPMLEAAFFGKPSIAAIAEPRSDTMIHGETGLAIPSSDPQLIAEAIRYFARNRDEAVRMGKNARMLAERNFRPDANARKLLEIYRRLVARKAPQAAAPTIASA
jgi:glycosyltransferase involved in cell wall biosynthesis